MKIAISGLGRMGGQIARKLAEGGHQVVAHNRSAGPRELAVKFGATEAKSKEEVAAQFKGQTAIVWVMLPDSIIEQELQEWLKVLPKNSILVDGGNSNFNQTIEHARLVSEAGSTLIDVGTSGGVWGLSRGFSMMIGGDWQAYLEIESILKTLAKPEGAYQHFGKSGSGHYVKMVHNAIEYGMMQSLAEGYRMLKEGPYKDLDLAAAGDVWQHSSVITSWLNELTRDALKENPELQGIDGVVAESGEARWTIETAQKLKIPLPAISASFEVRLASQKGNINFSTKLLAAMRNKFGGHSLNPNQD